MLRQTDKIALLAAYEAAVGPALRAIIVIPSEKVEKVEKAPKPEKKKTKSKKPGDKLPGVSSARPQSSAPRATASTTNGRADSKRKNHSSAGPADPYHDQQQYIQAADADPSSFYAPPQQQQHHQDAGDFERLERQALRRRKVEALESLAHTAALFLAEFMTHNNNKKESSRSSPGPGEPSGSAAPAGAAQNHGVDYAAAAAGMAVCSFLFDLRHSGILRYTYLSVNELLADYAARRKGRSLSNLGIKLKWPEWQRQYQFQLRKHDQQRPPGPGRWRGRGRRR